MGTTTLPVNVFDDTELYYKASQMRMGIANQGYSKRSRTFCGVETHKDNQEYAETVLVSYTLSFGWISQWIERVQHHKQETIEWKHSFQKEMLDKQKPLPTCIGNSEVLPTERVGTRSLPSLYCYSFCLPFTGFLGIMVLLPVESQNHYIPDCLKGIVEAVQFETEDYDVGLLVGFDISRLRLV